MNLLSLELKFVIENPKGSYKKFADTLEEYPVLGVTFPTHYGYIDGYVSEDGHDLDMFIGSGNLYGILRVNRDDVPDGIETKIILYVTENEYQQIQEAYSPVIQEIKMLSDQEIVNVITSFKK